MNRAPFFFIIIAVCVIGVRIFVEPSTTLGPALLEMCLALVTGLALGATLCSWLARTPSKPEFASVLFAVLMLTCFRVGHFYFWDEWGLLIQFQSGSIPVFHNEHYLPFFLPLLKALYSLAGDTYYLLQLLQGVILGLTGIMVLLVLKHFFDSRTACISSLLFIICSLHAETSSWAMLIGLGICQLLFALGAWLICCHSTLRRLTSLALLSFISPFFSMLGWLVFPQLVVFALWAKWTRRNTKIIAKLLAAGFGFLCSVAYLRGKTIEISDPSVADLMSVSFLKYLTVASEVGSGLRAFGLNVSPSIDHGAPAAYLGISEWTLFLILTIAGLCLSAALCVAAYKADQQQYTSLKAFLYYKLTAVLWFAPAIAIRIAEKSRGALSPRYHSPVVFSLTLFLASLLHSAAIWFKEGQGKRGFVFAALTIFCTLHLYTNSQFRLLERVEWLNAKKELTVLTQQVTENPNKVACDKLWAIKVNSLSPFSSPAPVISILAELNADTWQTTREAMNTCMKYQPRR